MTDQDTNHQAPTGESGPPSGPGGIAASIGARNLWIIILTMPVVFLVAVAMIIAIFGKPGKGGEEIAAADKADASPVRTAIDSKAPIALNAGETIRSVTLDGDRLAAIIDGPSGDYVVIYDVVTGEELSRIVIRRD